MLVKLIIIGLLLAIVGSLMTSMVFLVRDRSDRKRTLTGLKIRVALSIVLALALFIGIFIIGPTTLFAWFENRTGSAGIWMEELPEARRTAPW